MPQPESPQENVPDDPAAVLADHGLTQRGKSWILKLEEEALKSEIRRIGSAIRKFKEAERRSAFKQRKQLAALRAEHSNIKRLSKK